MLALRLVCSYGILFGVSLFVSSNVGKLGSGSGYLYLLFAILCFGAMITLTGELAWLIRIRRSTQLFIAFFAYFGIKYFFESGDIEQTKQVLVGTSGGVIFGAGLGLMCGHALANLYDLRFRISTGQIVVVTGLLYFVLVLFLNWEALQTHLGTARSDVLLIEDQEGHYQRAGALASMQIMLVVSLATILFASFKRIGVTSSALIIPLILAMGGFAGLMSQVVGSNSGLVASAGFIFVFIVNHVTMMSGGQRGYQSIEVTKVIFGPLGMRILFGSLIAGTMLAIAGFAAIKAFNIDTSMLRISGFGTGEVSSVESRSEIFEENFIRHLEFSPIFGNTQVDILTTGEGTYVHSLLALLTHLGFFGTAIFAAAVFYMYLEIVTPRRSNGPSLYASRRYGLFRLMMLSAVLVMCLYSAFFTWMPMWFALGLYGEWHYRR